LVEQILLTKESFWSIRMKYHFHFGAYQISEFSCFTYINVMKNLSYHFYQ